MSVKSFDELASEAIRKSFSGWDFSYLAGRYDEGNPSWDYGRKVYARMKGAMKMLDMGTGGGEFLAGLQPLPKKTFATESYAANVEVASARLTPLGVKVIGVESEANLPFPSGYFDLVINRHEEFHAAEVHRVLRPGGVFVTQQVGGRNTDELNQLLQKKVNGRVEHVRPSWSLAEARSELEDAGMRVIEGLEDSFPSRFSDIGAVVYFLRNAPWEIPDFDVGRYQEPLFEMHRLMERDGGLQVTSERFYIEAARDH